MVEGKVDFYKKAKESFTSKGYQFFSESDITGIGRSHKSKPDYIAIKNNVVIIGEIKSPAEPPTSASWRQIQNSDGDNFKRVRLEVAKRETSGAVSKAIGGHEIIIRGQLQDYFEKMGKTYDLYSTLSKVEMIIAGYTFPAKEIDNVKQALFNCNIDDYKEIDIRNGAVTFLFDSLQILASTDAGSNANGNTNIDIDAPLLAYYCLLKNYKGLFKKFTHNTHLLFFPVPDEKYIYLIIQGQLLDEADSYVCKLIIEMESHLLQPLINGKIEEFGKRFLIVEVLPCHISSTSDGYSLHLYKRGNYLKSDLKLQYLEDGPSYIVKGKLNLETEDRIL